MEIDIPDTIQFELKIPRKVDPKIIGKQPDWDYDLCFAHAVKAVLAGLKPTCTLTDTGKCWCDFCHQGYIAHEQGWYDNKPLLDGALL